MKSSARVSQMMKSFYRVTQRLESSSEWRTEVRGGKTGCSKPSMGINWVFIKLQGHQVTFPLSTPLFLSFFLSAFLSFFFLFVSCYTTLKGLVDSDELQCPTGNMLQWLSLELGGACCLYECATDQLFYPLIRVVVCNHASARVCMTLHACHSYQGIPFGALVWEECHNKPISVHKNTTQFLL